MLFNFSTWPQSGLDTWPPNMEYPSGVRVYDAYNPKARDIYWKYLNEGIFKLGMDGAATAKRCFHQLLVVRESLLFRTLGFLRYLLFEQFP